MIFTFQVLFVTIDNTFMALSEKQCKRLFTLKAK